MTAANPDDRLSSESGEFALLSNTSCLWSHAFGLWTGPKNRRFEGVR